jgi:hypothetical protein
MVARAAAVLAAGAALFAFWPRMLPVLDTTRLRTYLTSDEQFTQLTLMDTNTVMWEEGASLVRTKARRLKLAMAMLAISVVGFAVAALWNVGGSQ